MHCNSTFAAYVHGHRGPQSISILIDNKPADTNNYLSYWSHHNPFTNDQNQQFLIHFLNLGASDVIMPDMAHLAFNFTQNTADADSCTVTNNLVHTIVQKLTIHISGNNVFSIDDSYVLHCYLSLWKWKMSKTMPNIRVSTLQPNATLLCCVCGLGIATLELSLARLLHTLQQLVYIPPYFKLLESHMPFFQRGLGERLEHEITFKDYSKGLKTTDTTTKYVHICQAGPEPAWS